ncbi:MAG: helicase UvrD [Bacteroidetes bacterium]|jgi:ATP-dependent exoDNAse (exonuclease V) beta subunit|nr:helicase UvrD [Bacteroidota bacterium]
MSDKNFTIYKSSAGSGKTFTLVKEYLALALNDDALSPQAYKHILAITFTNKAAAEMKERIVKALKELAEDDYSAISSGSKTLLGILKDHKKLNLKEQLTDEIIRKRSKKILTAILHNYSDFAIGTIDAFVHKVVRTFAFDLKIPMSFEIEMDDEKLLTHAIDLLIAQIGSDERLTKALVEFTESKTDDEKSWHIETDLMKFAKNLLNEEGAVYIERLKELSVDDFFKIKEILFTEIKKFETFIVEEAKKANDLIVRSGLTSKQFFQGDKGIAGYFEKLARGRIDYIVPNSYVIATAGDDKWYAGKISRDEQGSVDSIKGQLLDSFNIIQTIKDRDHSNYILFQLINRNIYSLAVLNEIEKLLSEYKSQNNILHISEFNKMIAKIVLNEPIPFIYERLGERYNNYLIDEFQDTSVLQFQNLLPLIDNSLAAGHFTMLVGDGKQAIYRWRGGEVEQFAMLPEIFSHNDNPLVLEREEALKRNHDPQVLNKNFRSKREIIEFNNSLFRTLAGQLNEKYRNIYDSLEQEFNPSNTGGFVQVEFFEETKEEWRDKNFARTYEIIFQLLNEGYQLKDIAILVRKNTDGSDIANYLTEKNIPVISSDSLLLSNSKDVNFLHSILKFLANTSDNIVHAEILEYLISSRHIDNSSIDELIRQKNSGGLLPILRSVNSDFSIVKLSKMALYELIEELVGLFKLNESPNAYIQFYLDEVLNYSIKKNNNLNDFIEYWEDKKGKASLVIPQGMDAVSIMTIHRSKGLEFPVVILPFSNGKVKNGKDNLWITLENDKLKGFPTALVPTSESLNETEFGPLYEEEKSKSLLDSLNVLYVAFTRPEERMYILADKPSKNPSNFGKTSDMLAYYYQVKGEWQEGKNVYSFGKEVQHVSHQIKFQALNFNLKTFNSNQWRESIKMRTAAAGIWNTNMAETKKDYGVMVHTALSRINYSDDTTKALDSMLEEGMINIEERDHLTSTINNILMLPLLAPHFIEGLTVKNESEVISLTGEMFRPDRVVLNNKEAVIIDYKTGSKKQVHQQQIIQYGDLLIQMGYDVKEKLLVYIEELEIVSVK